MIILFAFFILPYWSFIFILSLSSLATIYDCKYCSSIMVIYSLYPYLNCNAWRYSLSVYLYHVLHIHLMDHSSIKGYPTLNISLCSLFVMHQTFTMQIKLETMSFFSLLMYAGITLHLLLFFAAYVTYSGLILFCDLF